MTERQPLAAACLCLAAALLSSCGADRAPAPPPREEVPVSAAAALRRDVAEELSAVGSVEASATVEVRSQVGGTLLESGFAEGHEVREGQVLFRIDPAPFEAALRQSEADLARDLAELENARQDEARYAGLASQGVVAPAQYERYRTAVSVRQAAVDADQARVENARLQLSRTVIRSPIGGVAGRVLVDRGNLVRANDTLLLVINQVRPAEVAFSVPQGVLSRVRAAMARGAVRVLARLEGEPEPVEGVLAFVDNAVDRATGTVRLRAAFPNRDGRLWPGQFARVSLTLDVLAGALVVPSPSVQMGQRGTFVWVVKEDGTVDMRRVDVLRLGDTEAVVGSGLNEGERVVTDGALRLTAGSKVAVRGTAAPTAPGPGQGAPPTARP